jgi:hypothetical protein
MRSGGCCCCPPTGAVLLFLFSIVPMTYNQRCNLLTCMVALSVHQVTRQLPQL